MTGACLLLAALVLSGCVAPRTIRILPRCADGLPPRLLTDLACPPDSICGYSCCPGRWQAPGEAIDDRPGL